MTHVCGLLLAAGAGRRLGHPKALLHEDEESLLTRAATRLLEGGCAEVVVVLGARAEEAHGLLEDRAEGAGWNAGTVRVVVAEQWDTGMGASLATGLWSVTHEVEQADALLVHLVDLPDVTADVMRRVVERWREDGAPSDGLLRASYDGVPGHPVLIGRDHWGQLGIELAGDEGARSYLAGRTVQQVECADLATGHDVDRPEDLR